jgi:oxygen-independent coproporphyrinogen III oxidase
VALFGYAHVPWMMPRQKLINDADLPNARQRYQQQLVAGNKLEEAGYLHIGLDHFALASDDLAIAAENGLLRRNFQGYPSDNAKTVIGLGASSISTFNEGFVQNSPDIRKWREKLDTGQFATYRGTVVTDDDCFWSDIIQALMCDLVVDFAPILQQWGRSPSTLDPAFERMREMETDGLVRRCGSVLSVTRLGRPFLRAICASFDQYVVDRDQSGRHARAI